MSDKSALSDRLTQRKLLLRGESLIGYVGLSTAAIVVAMLALAGWWSMRGQQESWQFMRGEQIRVLANVLSQSAESMLAGNDLSALRRLVMDAKREHDLTECRISLPDGRVVADANPTRITLVELPEQWPSGPLDDPNANSSSNDPQRIVITEPLLIKGRGTASLRIAATTMSNSARLWEGAAGIGMAGAAGLAAMLLLYRHMRSKVVTLGLIRESLLATQSGFISRDALTLHPQLGPEAAAWNLLLEENEALRKASVAERVKGSLGAQHESHNDLASACDALMVGMIIVDEQTRVKHANGAAAALLQAKRDEMIGKDVTELIDDSTITSGLRAIVTGSGQRRTVELRRSEGQGGGIIRVHVRPLRRDDAGGALITIEDITQQRVADAARNSFVAQATHELRTPLTNIRLCLENAQDALDGDPQSIRTDLNTMNQETRRLERMIGAMLSVAQIEAGSLDLKRDDVRMDKVFEELDADYRPQAVEKKITLSFELPPKLPVIQGDRDKVMVMLHNLLGNALKYTPSGGKVSLTVRSEPTQLTIDVSDTGIGISPEEQSKLFQKFYRAKDSRVAAISGTGLGLALAREIARLHGGDIAVQSELNKGSSFILTLPVVMAQAKAA